MNVWSLLMAISLFLPGCLFCAERNEYESQNVRDLKMYAVLKKEPENSHEDEPFLQDARSIISETVSDYEKYKSLPKEDLTTLKGWLNSCLNIVDLTTMPGFFLGVHLIKGAGALALMKAWIHLIAGVPETEFTFYTELIISGAYPTLETIYTTYTGSNK